MQQRRKKKSKQQILPHNNSAMNIVSHYCCGHCGSSICCSLFSCDVPSQLKRVVTVFLDTVSPVPYPIHCYYHWIMPSLSSRITDPPYDMKLWNCKVLDIHWHTHTLVECTMSIKCLSFASYCSQAYSRLQWWKKSSHRHWHNSHSHRHNSHRHKSIREQWGLQAGWGS
jgi:hypothetical protein